MITRTELQTAITKALKRSPVVALMGPRQCGKTTICKMIAQNNSTLFFDLENPIDIAILQKSPMNTLQSHKGLVIIDEVQRMQELFPILRVLSDQKPLKTRFLLLGSASPELMTHASESLAGRITFIDMSGFSLEEVGVDKLSRLWIRGGFPRSFLARSEADSFQWRTDFIRTFLERDIPALGITIPAAMLRRFWLMLAHYHGQIWNGSDIARSLSVTEPTVKKYLDILSGTYVIRQIQPWYVNISKRQVKAPKVYIRDSGLLHCLLTLPGNQINMHPKLGASWEGFVIEQLIHHYSGHDFYFWASHAGAELDLLVLKNGKKLGFEIKYADAPTITKSMRIAMHDIQLDHLYIVYPGDRAYQAEDNISIVPLKEVFSI